MNRTERLNAILNLLAEAGQVEVEDIVGRLGVSPATARRDLDSLANERLLTRTRGGATAGSVAYDLPGRYNRDDHAAQKQQIAQAASDLIPKGAVVGLCGGTTSTALAQILSTRPDLMEPSNRPTLTVVTNAINIAAQLAVRPNFKIMVTGGIVNPRSYELVGPYTDIILARVALDFAFIGINGIDGPPRRRGLHARGFVQDRPARLRHHGGLPVPPADHRLRHNRAAADGLRGERDRGPGGP